MLCIYCCQVNPVIRVGEYAMFLWDRQRHQWRNIEDLILFVLFCDHFYLLLAHRSLLKELDWRPDVINQRSYIVIVKWNRESSYRPAWWILPPAGWSTVNRNMEVLQSHAWFVVIHCGCMERVKPLTWRFKIQQVWVVIIDLESILFFYCFMISLNRLYNFLTMYEAVRIFFKIKFHK